MNSRILFLCLLIPWGLVADAQSSEPWLEAYKKSYDGGYEPRPPEPFPKAYKNYQILPQSISPDGKLALIYPKRSVLYTLKDASLYLARLKPFQILKEIPVGNLAANAHNGYGVSWAPDSTAVIALECIKWGVDGAYLLRIHDGKASEPLDLAEKVRKQLQADYKKSGALPYNDSIDYIFDADDFNAWSLEKEGRVVIDCLCTTDPNMSQSGRDRWEARFQGTWSMDLGRFTKKAVQRLKKRPHPGE